MGGDEADNFLDLDLELAGLPDWVVVHMQVDWAPTHEELIGLHAVGIF